MSEDEGCEQWEEIQALIIRLEPKIIGLFHRYQLSPEAAGEILEEVSTLLLYRWGEVASPDAWMLEMLEHKAWRSRAADA